MKREKRALHERWLKATGAVLCIASLAFAACSPPADKSGSASPPLEDSTAPECEPGEVLQGTDGRNDCAPTPSTGSGDPPLPEPDDVPLPEPDVAPPGCGNGILEDDEECDDGNTVAGTDLASWDGCGNCLAEDPGFVCPNPGEPCEFTNYCGDGRITLPETCDDLNNDDGDGCSAVCGIELGFACPTPGAACVYTVVCGDGAIGGAEQCDDMNGDDGDGCSSSCGVEAGWSCPGAGLRCTEACSDGIVVGRESCDDGNLDANDGCSAACQVEAVFEDMTTGTMVGWSCPPEGGACTRSVCGDGMLQGEPCDDGNNNDMGDGCSPGCRLEPNCTSDDGACISSCGDGLILAGDNEACDDGNNRSGDGCSATCTIEPGFVCDTIDDGQATTVSLPIVYRDFYGVGWSGRGGPPEYNTGGHPDFENEEFSRNTPKATVTSTADVTFNDIAAPTRGLVNATLGAQQTGAMAFKPVFANTGTPAQLTGAESFHQWYADTPDTNTTLVDNLVLAAAGAAGTFVFDTDEFYPIDGRGFTAAGAPAPGPEPMRPVDWLGQGCGQRQPNGEWIDLTEGLPIESRPTHNYSFTSEVRYWFEYQGGEQLTFRGDDDVWVFIKRRLVVDLGGNHEPYGGDVCGNVFSGIEAAPVCAGLGPETSDASGTPLGLEVGRVYEAVVFQAERHTCQSNYRLTLANFARRHSECATVCGDGVVAGDEQCDDGEMNGAGYGFCKADCTPGPRCGDAVVDVDGGEQCDNGVNLDGYDTTESACAPGCVFPGFCGDAIVDSAFTEECDNGTDGNTGEYDGCTSDCLRGPGCGDGILHPDNGETCDDGNRKGGDGCNAVCKLERVARAR